MDSAVRSLLRRKRDLLLPRGSLRGRFASGLFWSLSAAVISRGFNLAASVVCARLMGQAAFGEYGMVLSTVATLGAFSVLGLGLTASRYVAEYRDRDPEKVARILRVSSIVSLASGTVAAVLLALLSAPLAAHLLAAPRLATPLALGASMVLLNALIAFQNGALAGFEAFRQLARASLASGALSFPFIALGAWKGGVNGAVIGTTASLVVNLMLNRRILREQYRGADLHPEGAAWRQEAHVFWTFSLPAFLGSLAVSSGLWTCNALLVNGPGGYLQLGLYAAADRWHVAILFVPATVFRMVLPVLANLKGSSNQAGYRRVNRANLLLNLALVVVPAVLLGVLAGPIMASYGPDFRSGSPILLVLALGTIPEALNTVFGYPLVVGHRMWTRFAFDLLLTLVLATLGAALIPRWGALGLAAAYVAAYTATSVGLYLLTWRASAAT